MRHAANGTWIHSRDRVTTVSTAHDKSSGNARFNEFGAPVSVGSRRPDRAGHCARPSRVAGVCGRATGPFPTVRCRRPQRTDNLTLENG